MKAIVCLSLLVLILAQQQCPVGQTYVYANSSVIAVGALDTCQPCQANCVSCMQNWGLSSDCGASVPYNQCGTYGIICTQCAANYVMAINGNCYYCPATSTAALSSSSTENTGLVTGLIIWIVLTGVLTGKLSLT
jgi:hypothetical protein